MYCLNEKIPILVQTKYGNIPIENIEVGDSVYNFITGKEEKVFGNVTSGIEDIYKIIYTDGRQDLYLYSDLIYTGNNIVRMKDLFEDSCFLKNNPDNNERAFYGDIKQFQIHYNSGHLINSLYPDPYIAGALLIYGDRTISHLNLPLDRWQANSFLINKYQLEVSKKLKDNIVCLNYRGNGKPRQITWREFFPNISYDMMAEIAPIIPLEYMVAPIEAKWKFIKGVFDLGFDQKIFPNSCTINHDREEKLKAVQEMLWSMGILSIISCDSSIPMKRNYRLDIVSDFDNYSQFFYNIDSIEFMMEHRKRLNAIKPKFKVQIKSIRWDSRGYSSNLILKEPNTPYITDKFLPHLSVKKEAG